MSATVRAELLRIRSRAVTWGTLALVLLAATGLVIGAWHDTRPPSAQEVQTAQEAYAAALDDWTQGRDEWIDRCEETGGSAGTGQTCADMFAPPVLEAFLPYRPAMAEVVTSWFAFVGPIVALGMLLMSVSLVTADFASGAMAGWLTFQPRRSRVFAGRLLATAVAAVPLVVLTVVLTAGAMVAVLAVNDALFGSSGEALRAVAAASGRAVAGALWAVAIGAGLAFLLRHAAAVAGVVVWWVAALEVALPTLVPASRPYTLLTSLQAWFSGGTFYGVEKCGPGLQGGEVCDWVDVDVSQVHGGLVLLAVAVAVTGVSLLVFRLRDVG